ncbi:hypothetical protein P154DRAFT_490803 [Amniculicola lignicola CBS 123094]|uniref:Uncharacterized protein n=1 Tax=Amniculicola lignicola CBS 123094 TaxID=1392246 RepID=A0A6A5WJB3_9PLEO|nr:hypothetical protein P154DRAFT_490803 [Amniculicola lignicola CBS 123094]
MGGKLFLQNRLLPLQSVSLARFITDPKSPQRAFHDPFPSTEIDSTTQTQHNISELTTQSQSNTIGAQFTELLNIYKGTASTNKTHVNAVASIAYELLQWNVRFREACERPETRKWIEDAIEEGSDIYFIVGYRTFVDPSALESTGKSTSTGTEVYVPISTVAEANMPIVSLGGALDPGVANAKSQRSTVARRFRSEGEMVYAVQYCKIVFKWYSSRKIEKSALGPTKWKIHWGVRTVEEEDEEDVVGVELEEDFGEDE